MDIMVEEMDGGLWVAATEDGRLQGLEIDPASEKVRYGTIYRAKVSRIDKSLDAAFVDLGPGGEGILYNRDVRIGSKADAIGKRLRPGQMIAVQAKSGYLRREDEFDFVREDKAPTVSMDITIQGRFLVYAPTMTENRISSRIRGKKLQDQLLAMLDGFAPIKGLILRAASEDTQTDILLREAKILYAAWDQLSPLLSQGEAGPVASGPDSFQRMMGDQAGSAIERIEIVTMDRFKEIEAWCETFAPDLVPKIQPVEIEDATEELALFDHRGILGDIEDLFQEYGLLRGGGSIIIQETAALTAIDVNRGGDDRPVAAVNDEAAREIARQIRLRNIGGIIMIDFLKFASEADRKAFLKTLPDIFAGDPYTVQIHGLTALGLAEITRKRRTPPLSERMDSIDALNRL